MLVSMVVVGAADSPQFGGSSILVVSFGHDGGGMAVGVGLGRGTGQGGVSRSRRGS